VLSFSGIVCVSPLRLRGLIGKKSTPSVGWEVPVRSHRLENGSYTERVQDNDFGAFNLDKVILLKLLLAIKFNLHLFILMYSDVDFIAMSFPFTCIYMVIITPLVA
jgi:hypothetical protein